MERRYRRNEDNIQTFNDGIVDIYWIKNEASPGDTPKYVLKDKILNLRYEERTVGINRFWAAKQEQTQIEMLMRTQRLDIKTHDIAVIREQQYKILQIQHPKNVTPPCMDLSLERLEVAYEIK